MRRLLLALAAAAACATPPAQTTPTPQTILVSEDGVLRTNPVEGATIDSLPMPPDPGMRAVLAAYEQVGIAVTLIDPPTKKLGNPSFAATRTLAGDRLSRFVSCGQTRTGVRADESRVFLNIVSSLRATTDGKSLVETRLEASAQDVQSGNTADRMPCASTGVLESRIHAAAKARAPSNR